MDANGTRFHLLLGRDDWAGCSVESAAGEMTPLNKIWEASPPPQARGLAWNDERNELTLEPRLFKFVAALKDSSPSLENRRGAGRDAYGNWYWIDETQARIRVRSAGSGLTSNFWPLDLSGQCRHEVRYGDFQARDAKQFSPLPLSGLAVTENHFLVVGVIEPKGVLIFDLHAGGEPRQLLWPESVPFTPFDMAPMPGGGVWILDRRQHSYWALDRNFNVLGPKDPDKANLPAASHPADFQPVDRSATEASGPRSFAGSFSLADSLHSVIDPIAIEALPDGTVLILDYDKKQQFSRIHRYDSEKQLPDELSTKVILGLIEEEQQRDFTLVAYDLAFVPEHDDAGQRVQDRLYVVAADGNQTFAFRVCLRNQRIELQPIAEYLPMRLFGGKGVVAAGGGIYYDFAEGWIPLVAQRRPQYITEATLETPLPSAPDSPLENPPFDGREPDCVWHRLLIDACIPPETRVEVWSRAANDRLDLPLAPWQLEPPLHLRGDGSEMPFLRAPVFRKGQSSTGTTDGAGTWELLFQRARGRFLQLRIRLSGNERSTPRLRSLRAYYPRFSYLVNYLPAVYLEDEQSASFLDRYLANLEGFYTTLEDKIAMAQVLFDVRSAPDEVLDWLAGWFGIALDPTWDEGRRRLFIKHAMDFFQFRGTRRGLTMALHLALDTCVDETIFDYASVHKRNQEIRIVEKYLTRSTPGVVFGDPTGQSGPRNVIPATFWQPTQGRANLNQRYDSFLKSAGENSASLLQYPLIQPADAAQGALWSQFSQETLGFIPSTAVADRRAWQAFLQARYTNIASLNAAHAASYTAFIDIPLPRDLPALATALQDWQEFVLDLRPSITPVARRLWQDFMARRYRRIKALNQAYGTNWASFEVVSLPDELPASGAPLRDWFQFEGVVMQMQRTAHRFTVLLPVPLSLAFSAEEHQRRLTLSRRIIDLEKPAHAVFDVKFYWAMFRLGEARLQLDTVIDQGSRAPQLLPQLVLDQGFVGDSYLAAPAAEAARDRYILGRDPLTRTPDKESRS